MRQINPLYPRNPNSIPAATAEPITPATLGPIACISRWLSGSNSRPTIWDTLALSGTAETPAFPINGLSLCPSLRKRFMNLTKSTPEAVAIINDRSPNPKIFNELVDRNLSACVDAPTVRPIRMVTTSIRGPRAVSASLLVTPLSFSRLPKNSIPSKGRPDGTINAVVRKPTTGKRIFSLVLTTRGLGIRIRRSLFVVSASIIGR